MKGEQTDPVAISATLDRENRAETTEQLPAPVSILIVSYNARGDLAGSLASVLGQTYANYEIIVVDSGSQDDTIPFVRREFPQARLYASRENLGYRRGNNLGFQRATGKYVLLLNQDAELASDCLAEMVAVAEADPGVGLVAPKMLLFDKRERINEAGNTLHFTGMYGSRGIGEPCSHYASFETIAGISGCCFLVRREIVERLGGFSKDFDELATGAHASSEDNDLAWRAQLLVNRNCYTPRAVAYHKYIRKPMTPERFCSYEWGRWLMVARNFEGKTLLWLAPALLFLETAIWIYAIGKGKGWVKAKARIGYWFIRHIATLARMRAQVQAQRRIRDGVLLKRMSPSIGVTHVAPAGWPGRLLQNALDGFFAVYYRWLLFVATG